MLNHLAPPESRLVIAKFIRETTLSQNIKMADLAIRAGIGIATLARIEKKGVCSTDTLVRILAALGKLEVFAGALTSEETVSIDELRALSGKRRQRVRT